MVASTKPEAAKAAPSLFDQLKPLACKTTGDGACGLYAITHAVADLCAEGEENAKKKPGDAGIALRYDRLRNRLQNTVFRHYQNKNPGATFDGFIKAFIEAQPTNREKEFAPYFRELFYQHITGLDAKGFQALQDELGHKRTKEEYIQYLKDNARYWFQKNELTRILGELGINADVYQPVDASSNVVKLAREDALGIGPAKKYPYAGEIGLIHHRNHHTNQDLHWEWVAKTPERAAMHNGAHPGALYFGGATAPKASSSSASSFGSDDLFKIPEQFKGLFKQLGMNDESVWAKGLGFLVNIFMMMLGLVKTVNRWLNPDEPLDTEDLKMPGGQAMQAAVKALGKAGEGLNQAFRSAKTPEERARLSDAVIDRLVQEHQYTEAQRFLDMQQAELLNKIQDLQKECQKIDKDTLALLKGDTANILRADNHGNLQNAFGALQLDANLQKNASPEFRLNNFKARSAVLAAGWESYNHLQEMLEDARKTKALDGNKKEAEQDVEKTRKALADFEDAGPMGLAGGLDLDDEEKQRLALERDSLTQAEKDANARFKALNKEFEALEAKLQKENLEIHKAEKTAEKIFPAFRKAANAEQNRLRVEAETRDALKEAEQREKKAQADAKAAEQKEREEKIEAELKELNERFRNPADLKAEIERREMLKNYKDKMAAPAA